MKRHDLKCWPEPFQAIWDGSKRHEVRINDRDYNEGDELLLREFDSFTAKYTGRTIRAKVGYVTEGGSWGLPDNLCVMTLQDVVV